MAKRKSAKKAVTVESKGCIFRLRTYGKYIWLLFGACCIVSLVIGLFSPSDDETTIPTLAVLPSITPLPATALPTHTSIPASTIDIAGTEAFAATMAAANSRASETAMAHIQAALSPTQTLQPVITTVASSPTNDPLIFTVEAMQTEIELTSNTPTATFTLATAQNVQLSQSQPTTIVDSLIPTAVHPDVGKEVASFTLLVQSFDPPYEYIVQGEVGSYLCASRGICTSTRTYSTGDVVTVSGIAMSSDGDLWYQISRWLGDSYIPFSTDLLPQTLASQNPDAPILSGRTTGCSFTFYVVSGGANLRSCERTECELLSTISQGETVILNEWTIGEMYRESNGWYQVWYGNDLGYIHESRLSCSPSQNIKLFPFEVP